MVLGARWRSGQVVGVPPSWSKGQQVRREVGVSWWSATVLASCLLVGLRSSPAPGDRYRRADSTPERQGTAEGRASTHERSDP
jgi:hypothetical protein